MKRLLLALLLLPLVAVGTAGATTKPHSAANLGQITKCPPGGIYFISNQESIEGIQPEPDASGNFLGNPYTSMCLPDSILGKLWVNIPGYGGPWQNSWGWSALINMTPERLWIKGYDSGGFFSDCIDPSNVFYLHGRDAQPSYWTAIQQTLNSGGCGYALSDYVEPVCTADNAQGTFPNDGPFEVTAKYITAGTGAPGTPRGDWYPIMTCYQTPKIWANGGLINWQAQNWFKRVWLFQHLDGSQGGDQTCYDNGYLYRTPPLEWENLPDSIELTQNFTPCV